MSTEPNFGPTFDPNAAWCFGPIMGPSGSIAGQQADYGPGIDPGGVAPVNQESL